MPEYLYANVEHGMPDNLTSQHQQLIERLREQGDLPDSRIERAFERVPRHLFLPDIPIEQAYQDESIVVRRDMQGEAICVSIFPSIVARMLTHCDLKDGQNILEIGTGTAYSTALIRQVAGQSATITSLELDPTNVRLAKDNLFRAKIPDIQVVQADGAQGYAPRATYDRIISTVGVWDIPQAWLNQLKPRGKLIVPLWLDGLQVITTFERTEDDTWISTYNSAGVFLYMGGMAQMPTVKKRVGSTSLTLLSDQAMSIDTASLHLLLSHDDEICHLGHSLKSHEYWYGFVPYAMLNEPDDAIFMVYEIEAGQQAYGMEGKGFGVFTPASAIFVPYMGMGTAHSFAGSDAYMTLESLLDQWEADGRLGMTALRIRLIPKRGDTKPSITSGKLYERHTNYLHIWQEESL